jgi:hypothetical protein
VDVPVESRRHVQEEPHRGLEAASVKEDSREVDRSAERERRYNWVAKAHSIPCQQKPMGFLNISTQTTVLVEKGNFLTICFIDSLGRASKGKIGRSSPSEIDSLSCMEDLHPQNIVEIVNDASDTLNYKCGIRGPVFDFTCSGKVVC